MALVEAAGETLKESKGNVVENGRKRAPLSSFRKFSHIVMCYNMESIKCI